ncbi:MAG TPA: hypothetical protein VHV55_10700, partial [Pirellulales bacterium]|nr:hypothetical protein [Pirellulales bacterium]
MPAAIYSSGAKFAQAANSHRFAVFQGMQPQLKSGLSGISFQMGLMIKTVATGRTIHCHESRLQWLQASWAVKKAFGIGRSWAVERCCYWQQS